MARKKKPFPILENVTITDVAAEGKSLVRITTPAHDGQPESQLVVFVPWAVPGDVVDLQIRRKKHSYAEAEVVRYRQLSPIRTQPRCQHFGVCGGCKWQQLPYEEQLRFKQQQVYDQLTRIGHLQLPKPGTSNDDGTCTFQPIMGSVEQYEYRNKLDFGAANKRYLTKEEIQQLPEREGAEGAKNIPALGFHITGAFDKILPIEQCHLMHPLHNDIRNDIRDYALQNGLSFFDLREQTGLLRDVIIRNSNTGEWMVIVQVKLQEPDDQKKVFALLQHIADKFQQISALLWVDNQKCNDTFGDLDVHVFKGNNHIIETMEDLRFKVGPKSFYQTNTEQAYHLYSVAREFAFSDFTENSDFSENSDSSEYSESSNSSDNSDSSEHSENSDSPENSLPLVYDLYTGTGTIANFVARKARQVIGIEYVPEAIEDAKVNSQLNHIDNTLFYAGDMKDILTDDFIRDHGRPDVIITDPPRAGMHSDVVKTIINAAPKRIVYVSCNPATQARDLEILTQDYRISRIQPVDMFPHTPHVENVVLLERL
ncbi:MAG: class I SAM-dependent RNA methyltransferase [Bacteroidales bacterium]|nr:class I SAM-dependent RNA methyltransferase [Bacteroidales bacterium]